MRCLRNTYLVQEFAGECLRTSSKTARVNCPVCSVCQLPWCGYSLNGLFQPTSVTPLNVELARDAHNLLPHAGVSWLQPTADSSTTSSFHSKQNRGPERENDPLKVMWGN